MQVPRRTEWENGTSTRLMPWYDCWDLAPRTPATLPLSNRNNRHSLWESQLCVEGARQRGFLTSSRLLPCGREGGWLWSASWFPPARWWEATCSVETRVWVEERPAIAIQAVLYIPYPHRTALQRWFIVQICDSTQPIVFSFFVITSLSTNPVRFAGCAGPHCSCPSV